LDLQTEPRVEAEGEEGVEMLTVSAPERSRHHRRHML
jgi:hypothetical protein